MRRSCRHMPASDRPVACSAQEVLRRVGLEDQILALIGRAFAEAAQLRPSGPATGSGTQIARIDRLHPLGRRQRGVAGRDGDEQALVRSVGAPAVAV